MQRWFAGLTLSLLSLGALSRAAPAQTPCQGSTGPDVIVGDIQEVANYGAVGGLEALSLGTTSCNMGDFWLNWIANTNQHPVIAGHLYRYKIVDGAGRFEQVGLSWLKHGFFALSGNVCCTTCIGDPTGTHLGIGCSDPYTAQRNGTQSGLGPRYQVNADTGAFTYPPPTPSGGNTGRLEVLTSDLEPSSPTGTRYFGECQYVTPDDAAAGHQNNNASYRGMTVAGSGSSWNFGSSGSTQREQPAIEAWKAIDPAVTLVEHEITNEGLMILGYKTTALGDGRFRYEYAVYNMNSDAAFRSFSVRVPTGVLVSNIGFHDVSYRGGDGVGGVNHSGTDWTAVYNTSPESHWLWSTETFAQNQNANAIRWGTTYNFRFDSYSPPSANSGNVQVGRFKIVDSPILFMADAPGAVPGRSFCPGDGTLATPCPCSNSGSTGNGCANSQNPSGARLSAVGETQPDQVVLTSIGELPTSLSIFLQGTVDNGTGVVFGDGVRCVAGTLKRLYVKSASGGTVSAPGPGDPVIQARSAQLGDPIPSGATRYYQVYYRDANPGFCPDPPGNTFNSTNGWLLVW